jgi:two-component system CheB/CheR fusion protein
MSQSDQSVAQAPDTLFPVVGVGASAGGLDAFRALVKAIPEDSGMAWILVQHFSSKFESILSELVQKVTAIPVLEAKDRMRLLPNNIYVVPSNQILAAGDGMLLLHEPGPGEKRNAIDAFFSSLSEVYGEHTIGVLLSGTGTDGTAGLRAIRRAGGITIAQDEKTATYFSMPGSAIGSGTVDFVLPPEEIPVRLHLYMKRLQETGAALSKQADGDEEISLAQLMAFFKTERGIDFTYYKQAHLLRRIGRRKTINGFDSLSDYAAFMFGNKAEQDALLNDLLVGVTGFFRDPEAFEALKTTVFPVLFHDKKESGPIRIWSAGCATGKEAYSLAICLIEFFGEAALLGRVQIFATDLSEAAIALGRNGLYSKAALAGVSEERIERFFTKKDGLYQVSKPLRDMVVFACHNFLKDPPFSRIDLLCCRNVLIYLEPYLQRKALNTFNYALHSNGFLMLGLPDSEREASARFYPFSAEHRLFSKRLESMQPQLHANEGEPGPPRALPQPGSTPHRDDFRRAADEALLARVSASGVVINDHLDILEFRGQTRDYLEAQPGRPSHNLLRMAREGLSFELRNAVYKARTARAPIVQKGVPLEKSGARIDIEVIPLRNTIEPYYLVLFEEPKDPDAHHPSHTGRRKHPGMRLALAASEDRVHLLEQELMQARLDMEAISEAQQYANEELQTANQELLSGGEELQSLNAQLEKTKEEIQSSNEELTVLNQELVERNDQLLHAHRYAEAIVSTIHEPLMILSGELRIRSANKAFYQTFGVSEKSTDGVLFFEWQNGLWNIPGLRKTLESVLAEDASFDNLEVTVPAPRAGQRVLVLNARQLVADSSEGPYILLALQDITGRKELELAQFAFSQELERQVREQTAELKEANTRLQISNEMLQQFATIATHDLQEPLRKIRTFGALLQKRYAATLPSDGRELVSKVMGSAERMSQLITEVRNYSKVATGRLNPQPCSLDGVLRNVLEDLDLLMTEKGAQVDYVGRLPVAEVNCLQMNQLFYNLLSNSLKYAQENIPPRITITHKLVEGAAAREFVQLREDLSYLEIRVTDNGIGFEQPFAEQVFGLFERLHTMEDYEGTGVGLALCKRIVENHQGHIYALSEKEQGSTFVILLPLAQMPLHPVD